MSVYTEAEADKRLCCVDLRVTCQGSKCMAWRWAVLNRKYDEVYYARDLQRAKGIVKSPPTAMPEDHELVGYCGRAASYQ